MRAQVLGTIDGSGKIVLVDRTAPPEDPTPVDLNLDQVLGDLPRKTFKFSRTKPPLNPIQFPEVCCQLEAGLTQALPTGCSGRESPNMSHFHHHTGHVASSQSVQ